MIRSELMYGLAPRSDILLLELAMIAASFIPCMVLLPSVLRKAEVPTPSFD